MSSDVQNSSKKFEEALHLLNEAAKDKKEDVQRLAADKYKHLKDALLTGQEKLTETIAEVDDEVHKNPWPYISGVAIGALLVGFILGSQKK